MRGVVTYAGWGLGVGVEGFAGWKDGDTATKKKGFSVCVCVCVCESSIDCVCVFLCVVGLCDICNT